VTGGYYVGLGNVAQLCVWDGATLTLENVKTWQWGYGTSIYSVALGDVDGDGKEEIVSGGLYVGLGNVAQLCVWDGATLTLKVFENWQWGNSVSIASVALGDVYGDGKVEVATGGGYSTTTVGSFAQLCVWSGA